MLDGGVTADKIKQEKAWFTHDELHSYKLAQDIDIAIHWKEDFGTTGPIEMEVPHPSEELVKGYQKRVRQELKKNSAREVKK